MFSPWNETISTDVQTLHKIINSVYHVLISVAVFCILNFRLPVPYHLY